MTRQRAREIEAAAARWVARMDAGEWSDADERELSRWLAVDERRAGALLQAQAAWQALDGGRHTLVPAPPLPVARAGVGRRRLLALGGGALAASAAGAVLLLGRGDRYVTDVGEIRRVPLADGSLAAINTASSVAIDLTDVGRVVTLDSGEAWFHVAKDPARPFVVTAGGLSVRAIGTAFAVRRRDTRTDVLVTEGVVQAQAAGLAPIRLGAGEHAVFAAGAWRVAPPAEMTIDRTLAWREGKIVLAGMRLADATAEFNRYNRRRFVIVDPALAGERFDGVFNTDDVAGFAVTVAKSLDVPVDLAAPDVIRIGARRA